MICRTGFCDREEPQCAGLATSASSNTLSRIPVLDFCWNLYKKRVYPTGRIGKNCSVSFWNIGYHKHNNSSLFCLDFHSPSPLQSRAQFP
jgi:hypothetical protein